MNNETAIIMAMVIVIVVVASVIAATDETLDFADEALDDIRDTLIEQSYHEEIQKHEVDRIYERGEFSWRKEIYL